MGSTVKGSTVRSVLAASTVAAGTLVAAPADAQADAQTYPARPIRLIVPAAPGGQPDLSSRLIAAELTRQMGQQVVVDNRPGASNIIGFEITARSAPDGYTLGYVNFPLFTNPSLHAKLPYDAERDFQYIVYAIASHNLLTASLSLPVKSLQELIDHARAYPGKLSYGSQGAGNSQQLAMELLKIMTGTQIVQVSYKGIQQAITDEISGQIHLVCDNMGSILPQVRAGRLRGLGVTAARRSPAAPDIPTVAEAGVPGYEMTLSSGYAVSRGTPREIVMRLNAEINRTLRSSTAVSYTHLTLPTIYSV